MLSMLRVASAEYTDSKLAVLTALMENQPTDEQLRAGGIDRVNGHTRFEGAVNYLSVYEFFDSDMLLRMCDIMRSEMGVPEATVGALRAKVHRNEREGGRPLLLGISGEGVFASAMKYDRWLSNPPDDERARAGRQLHRGVRSDVFFFNIPAAATLVGEGCLDTINVTTYVVRTGDRDRNSREAHEAIIALGVMNGLLHDRESFSLNQKVGGTFTDEQRRKGGERPRPFRAFDFPPFTHLCSVLLIQPWLEGVKVE